MTYLVWRQYRLQWAIALALLAAIAVVEVIDGLHMASAWHSLQVACGTTAPTAGQGGGCLSQSIVSVVGNDFRILSVLVPAVLGILWGAPLIAHEMETGTTSFAWTQGTTRTRWLVAKVGYLMLAAVIWAGAASALVTWWSGPENAQRGDQFQSNYFNTQGIVPVGYAVVAMALGITAGVLIRRTVPAIAVTLAGYVALRAWFAEQIQFHLLPAVTTYTSLASTWSPGGISIGQGATVINAAGQNVGGSQFSTALYMPNGNPVATSYVPAACHQFLPSPIPPGGGNASPSLVSCLSKAGFRNVFSYQPGSRYWEFQGLETGIYVLMAAILLAVAFYAIRRRDA
ncbi:MAG TPA: hypothetical protein VMU95_20910 [Trebonia sp.]|nr:hypothetical protein [Trebonia sp.]